MCVCLIASLIMFVTNECFLGTVVMILVNLVLQLCFDDVCWPEDTVNVAVVRACQRVWVAMIT